MAPVSAPKLARRRPGPRSHPAPASAPPAPSKSLAPLLVAAVLITTTITWFAYSRALDHDFVNWDDPHYVTENVLVRKQNYRQLLTTVVSLNYHPLTMISLAADAAEPLSARPFIRTNVLLHLVNTGLVLWLAFLLSGRRILVAAFVALLFGIHPMHVESVVWVSERKDVLYTLFFLAAAMAYWRYLEVRRWRWLSVTFGLFLLSCLSKGMAVVFPLVMLLLDFWKRRPLLERRAMLEKVPFLAVSLLFGLIALDVQAGGDFHGLLTLASLKKALVPDTGFTSFQRLAFPSYGHMMYVARLLVPVNLSPYYPYPSTAEAGQLRYVLAPIFLLLTLALGVWGVRRAPLLAFGIGWYLAAVVMVLQWIPVGSAIMADRYTYLSSVGLFFLLAMGIDEAYRRSRAVGMTLWGMGAVFSGFLFLRTVQQAEVWRDSESLWTAVLRTNPNAAMAHNNLGILAGGQGRLDDAIHRFRAALAIQPNLSEARTNLGFMLYMKGHTDSAIAECRAAVRAVGSDVQARINLGLLLAEYGEPEEAGVHLREAARLAPFDTTARGALQRFEARRPSGARPDSAAMRDR